MGRQFLPVFVSMFLGLIGLYASGQESNDFTFYMEAGLDNSNIRNSGTRSGSSLTLPFGGMGISAPTLFPASDSAQFPKNLQLSLSALFAGRGSNFNNPSFKQRFFYADFPLRLSTPVFQGLNAFAGFQPSYLIDIDRNKKELIQYEDVPIKDARQWAYSIGGGVSFPLSDKLDMGLGYWHNVSRLSGDYKHSWARLSVRLDLQKTYEDLTDGPSKEDSLRLANAKAHIQNLKEGTLLVRLSSKTNTIQALEEKGHYWEAVKVEGLNRSENREIAAAFRENYNFSEVYFFYDTSTQAIQEGKFEGHVMDSHLQLQRYVDVEEFYIADLGDTYLESEKGMFNGLVIRDARLNVLSKPFPYKIEGHGSLKPLDLDRSAKVLVNKLKNALWKFYYAHGGKTEPGN